MKIFLLLSFILAAQGGYAACPKSVHDRVQGYEECIKPKTETVGIPGVSEKHEATTGIPGVSEHHEDFLKKIEEKRIQDCRDQFNFQTDEAFETAKHACK